MKKLCLFLAYLLLLQRCFSQVDTLAVPEATVLDSVPLTQSTKQTSPPLRDPDLHGVRPHRLLKNTGIVIGASLVSFGLLCLLPEESTSWHKKEFSLNSMTVKWKEHITAGPVWDGDKWIYNYVLHPYAGALYYMGARGAGCRIIPSFFYSALMSTFLWEYGIEAFAEVPSTQDLIVTPVAGSVIGEGFYSLKKNIRRNNDRLFGARWAGAVTLWLIDPLNQMTDLLEGGRKKNTMTASGMILPAGSQFTYQFSIRICLDAMKPRLPVQAVNSSYRYRQ